MNRAPVKISPSVKSRAIIQTIPYVVNSASTDWMRPNTVPRRIPSSSTRTETIGKTRVPISASVHS